MKVTQSVLRTILWWRSRTSRVQQFLAEITPRRSSRPPSVSALRVAAVQMEIFFALTAEGYAERMLDLVQKAVDGGAEFIVFPEDVGLPLIGLVPDIQNILEGKANVEEAIATLGPDLSVADLFRALGGVTRRVYETTFSELARMFGVYIAAGSAMVPDSQGDVYNVAHLYGPDGSLIGKQPKCHLLPMEEAWGIQRGQDVFVHQLPFGKVATPICMDATYYETSRLITLFGAEMIVLPTANPEPYNPFKAMRGIWPRVQEAQVYGVSAALVGHILGLTLEGKSGFYAPMGLTTSGDGILAESESVDKTEIVFADLDFDQLRMFRQRNMPRYNVLLYERYLPQIYNAAFADESLLVPEEVVPASK